MPGGGLAAPDAAAPECRGSPGSSPVDCRSYTKPALRWHPPARVVSTPAATPPTAATS